MATNAAPTLAGRMLCASVLSYSIPFVYPPPPPIPQTQPYYNGAGYLTVPTMIASDDHNANAACTVGLTNDGIVVAFRGTVYNSIGDWMNDLLLELVKKDGIPGKIHEGFTNAVAAIFNPLLARLKILIAANPRALIFLTGHSKGAGMAPIAAYYLYTNGINAKALYLFAPPLPGDAAFANAYNAIFPYTYLYENYMDIVPLLPPSPSTAGGLDYYLTDAIIQGKISEDWLVLVAAIFVFGLKGYSPVSSVGRTFYIPPPVNNIYKAVPMTNVLVQQQLRAIATGIIAGDFAAFANAHNSRCGHGHGYMNALGGGIC